MCGGVKVVWWVWSCELPYCTQQGVKEESVYPSLHGCIHHERWASSVLMPTASPNFSSMFMYNFPPSLPPSQGRGQSSTLTPRQQWWPLCCTLGVSSGSPTKRWSRESGEDRPRPTSGSSVLVWWGIVNQWQNWVGYCGLTLVPLQLRGYLFSHFRGGLMIEKDHLY